MRRRPTEIFTTTSTASDRDRGHLAIAVRAGWRTKPPAIVTQRNDWATRRARNGARMGARTAPRLVTV